MMAEAPLQLRFIYIRNQTEKPQNQHRDTFLMLLGRNEAVKGLISLRTWVSTNGTEADGGICRRQDKFAE
jgi:hypothetical protein